ncbi:hypothetical protein M2164_006749 [Streptomyces sp. SAI-208]|nr:hypothetical protein [Streptomyces sp. SAI-090]MDH6552349.1 hypothetical protein [Streptomyces sp. SAI-041]MDH6611114.1 hypothetical protein [Streptomyces sp. SAI-208]MDH6615775.1 hypothetical protein [Streptomyces sp. SAI-135]
MARRLALTPPALSYQKERTRMADPDLERDSGWLSGGVVDANDARLATGVFASAATDSTNPIAARTGVKPGPGNPGGVEAEATPSRSVKVQPFQGVVQGTRVSYAGAYLITLGRVKTLDVLTAAPAHSSYARIVLVVARQTDRQYGDASDGMVVQLEAGAPAPTPVAPRLTDDFLPLAQITVRPNAGSITQADIKDLRVFTVATGGVLPLQSHESLPAEGYAGQRLYDLETGLDLVRGDTAWRPAVTGAVQFFGPADAGWPRAGSTEGTNFLFNQVTVTPAPYPRMLMCTAQMTAQAQSADARFDHVIKVLGESGNLSISAFDVGPTLATTTVATAHRLMPAGTTPLVLTQQFVRVAGSGTVSVPSSWAIPVYAGLRVVAFPVP